MISMDGTLDILCNIGNYDIGASIYWGEVTCKKCLKLRKENE